MQDVADRLGITKMTVSRYLNDPQSVAEKTRQKIKQAIDELGFVASKVPAMLSKDSSRALGVLIPSFSNMVFAEVIQGITQVAEQHNYTVLITHTSYQTDEEDKQIEALLSYQVDGLILTEPRHSDLTCRRIQAMGVSCAEIMSLPEHPIDCAVGLDHEEIMYQSTKTLLECGRRHPAYIGVRLDIRTLQRQRGYERAMVEAGLTPVISNSEARSSFTMAGPLMAEALHQHPDIDAVLTTNDDVAVGAMLYCQSVNIRIPEDIAIIGYNGLNIAQATIPPLCSLGTPRYLMGSMAVHMLIDSISGLPPERRVCELNCTLTQGQTLLPEERRAFRAMLQNRELQLGLPPAQFLP